MLHQYFKGCNTLHTVNYRLVSLICNTCNLFEEDTQINSDILVNELASMVNELASMVNELASMANELASMANELASMVNELASMVNELASMVNELAKRLVHGTIVISLNLKEISSHPFHVLPRVRCCGITKQKQDRHILQIQLITTFQEIFQMHCTQGSN